MLKETYTSRHLHRHSTVDEREEVNLPLMTPGIRVPIDLITQEGNLLRAELIKYQFRDNNVPRVCCSEEHLDDNTACSPETHSCASKNEKKAQLVLRVIIGAL